MDVTIRCPQCARLLALPQQFVGRSIRCPSCAHMFSTQGMGTASTPIELYQDDRFETDASSGGDIQPEQRSPPAKVLRRTAPGTARQRWPRTFNLKIIDDPGGMLQGVYQAQPSSEGLSLSRRGREHAKIPVGAKSQWLQGNRFVVFVKGRTVTIAVSPTVLEGERLTRDVVRFLSGEGEALVLAEYLLPKPLLVAAFLPAGILFAGLSGGALGGALAGGLAGGLITANLAIARQPRLSLIVRIATCLLISLAAYSLFALALVGLWMVIHPAEIAPAPGMTGNAPSKGERKFLSKTGAPINWGTQDDPDGDCRLTVDGRFAHVDVPGTSHDLDTPPALSNAPRILRRLEGDFVAEVDVVSNDPPSTPPAPPSRLAYHGAGLLLCAEDGAFLRLEQAAFVRDGQLRNYVLFERHRPGANSDEQNGFHNGGPISLRMERRGKTVIGSYRTSQSAWTSLPTFDFPAGRASVGVAAVNTASATFHARFENFRVVKP
jgi:regulation of enolase protein 1 (concanavalin A-like superfamily)/phage FluMu protein Com